MSEQGYATQHGDTECPSCGGRTFGRKEVMVLGGSISAPLDDPRPALKCQTHCPHCNTVNMQYTELGGQFWGGLSRKSMKREKGGTDDATS